MTSLKQIRKGHKGDKWHSMAQQTLFHKGLKRHKGHKWHSMAQQTLLAQGPLSHKKHKWHRSRPRAPARSIPQPLLLAVTRPDEFQITSSKWQRASGRTTGHQIYISLTIGADCVPLVLLSMPVSCPLCCLPRRFRAAPAADRASVAILASKNRRNKNTPRHQTQICCLRYGRAYAPTSPIALSRSSLSTCS